MEVRSTQGQNMAVRSTQGEGGVTLNIGIFKKKSKLVHLKSVEISCCFWGINSSHFEGREEIC